MSHRTHVTLTDAQYARLREESARTGVALTELVRRALAATYGGGSRQAVGELLEATFGAWSEREIDGEEYVDRLRMASPHQCSPI